MLDFFIIQPFLTIFKYLVNIFNDFGLAIIFFSLFLKILISPLSFLQFKEEIKLKKIKEKIDKLTKKEKDLLKKAEIISKVYEEEQFNPLYNIIIQFSTLPFYLGAIIVIQNLMKNLNNTYFLNIIDLSKPNIYLSLLVIIAQFIFVFNQPKENRKMLLFITGVLAAIILFFPSAFLIYFFMSLILTLLERKLFNWYNIKLSVVSVEENNPNRS